MITLIFVLICLTIPQLSQAQNLLSHPQKIVIDAVRNRLLVSNGRGGALVQIDSDGNQTYLDQDAGFVDGMEIVGDTVFGIGNGRKLIAYDLNTDEQILNFTFAGESTKYLSSIASDSLGHLFISCPSLNTIYKYRISDHSYWTFVANDSLVKPNGILLERENNRIVVISDAYNSHIYAVSLSDSTFTTLATTTLNNPDGIVRDVDGTYYIAGYYLLGLYREDANFSSAPTLIFAGNHFVYPTYDSRDHSILLTYYIAGDWVRVSLATGIDDQTSVFTTHDQLTNYPNPFNPETTVSFNVTNKSQVEITIYNMKGQKVKTLTDMSYAAGTHNLLWGGLDEEGKCVCSGLYFCRLKVDSKNTNIRKMLLLK